MKYKEFQRKIEDFQQTYEKNMEDREDFLRPFECKIVLGDNDFILAGYGADGPFVVIISGDPKISYMTCDLDEIPMKYLEVYLNTWQKLNDWVIGKTDWPWK